MTDQPTREARLRSLCRMLRHAQGEADDLGLDDLMARLEQAMALATGAGSVPAPANDILKARRRLQ